MALSSMGAHRAAPTAVVAALLRVGGDDASLRWDALEALVRMGAGGERALAHACIAAAVAFGLGGLGEGLVAALRRPPPPDAPSQGETKDRSDSCATRPRTPTLPNLDAPEAMRC